MIDEVYLIGFFVLITGACIGSFLNVVALRALSKESIILPASKCPKCNEPIKWYDNLPIISYLFIFRGKCRSCGCKVSLQYPIVEALTAILFLLTYIGFGLSVLSLLIALWICTAIVITITDIKEQSTFDTHLWVLIILSIIISLFHHGLSAYTMPLIGLITGVVVMELIAKLSYYLVRKENKEEEQQENEEKTETQPEENKEENKEEEIENEEDIDINEYVKKKKRAFGEGDTYIAAASGALLGWVYIFAAIALAIIVQALCILPQFFKRLYDKGEFRLLFSLSAFFVIAVLYWILTNTVTVNLFIVIALAVLLLFFAIDTILRLKKTVNEQGFAAIPFGPSLIIATAITFIYGRQIVDFAMKHIFMFFG
jgi:leader peptidase (prepilin peptidase)/N-methyltransferase